MSCSTSMLGSLFGMETALLEVGGSCHVDENALYLLKSVVSLVEVGSDTLLCMSH